MILVVGETLVDLVVAAPEAGELSVVPALGGAPSNAAVAAARLGAPVAFCGAVSVDRFGDRLVDRLVDDGVDVRRVVRVEAPTSLAMAELGADGAADYRFYFAGTSVPELRQVSVDEDVDVVLTGGLALVLEPMATAVEVAVTTTDRPVVVDVNARPAVIPDLDGYRHRLERIAASAAVIKASDEDLAVLAPELEARAAAARLVGLGADAVVVTRGASATTLVTAESTIEVPVEPLPDGHRVVDTIGAGDTFVAAMVVSLADTGWFATRHGTAAGSSVHSSGDTSTDRLATAIRFGHAAAAITVTRRGADPPWRTELG